MSEYKQVTTSLNTGTKSASVKGKEYQQVTTKQKNVGTASGSVGAGGFKQCTSTLKTGTKS